MFRIDIREGQDFDSVSSTNFPNKGGLSGVTIEHSERLGSTSRHYEVSWSSGRCAPEQIEEYIEVLRAAARQVAKRREENL